MSSTFAQPSIALPTIRMRGRRRPAPDARTAEPVKHRDLDAVRAVPGWHIVERSAFGFVDQVVVAPATVIAITARHHLPLEGDAHVQRAWKAIRDAKGSAALMQQMLGPDAPDVAPVLVLSGPGAPELADGHMLVKGVRVVDGRRPELWAHLFSAPVFDELEQRRLARSLRL